MKLTQKLLKELFRYDKDIGELIWRDCGHSKKVKGKIAGGKTAINISIDGERYNKVKLKAFYLTGVMPVSHRSNCHEKECSECKTVFMSKMNIKTCSDKCKKERKRKANKEFLLKSYSLLCKSVLVENLIVTTVFEKGDHIPYEII